MRVLWLCLLFLLNVLLIFANIIMTVFHVRNGNTAFVFVSGGATLLCIGAAIFNVATLLNMKRRK